MREPWWKNYHTSNGTLLQYQNVSILSTQGSIQVPLSLIDKAERNRILTGMTVSAQLALGVLIMVMSILLSSPEKRRTPVFIVNSASIVSMCIRAILMIVNLCSKSYSLVVMYGFALQLVHEYVHVFDVLVMIVGTIIIITAEISMLLQIRIISAHDRKTQRIMTCISAGMGLVVVAFWFTNMCQQINYLLWLIPYNNHQISGYYWVYFIAKILFAISVIFHSAVFSYKLFHAIQIRKKIGQFPFGPMQCILIISCQCLFVPAIFTIIDSFIHTYDGFSSMTQCLLIISLPLSSLWASSTALKLQSLKTTTSPGDTTQVSIRVDRTYDIKRIPTEELSSVDESDLKKWP
ncbi:pheromone p-factor receptor [Schizosaccharomyces cryophilus OY26]|uniref:Pheromone p-factor receptor n=1 Tax=Schizosaccharomyces cryophilus (strain OY26 / ATCC MYA-4695 / CBS 11777 / NBRC 106824 / NRRL Y48691) TaxID=653667 RepID=S9VVX5_SCHCR|nr:pheromone p-factor receptor [Schizosaccharomyces cryophilus OY26]EPY50339.1 pheromone p-factor receptor [Schizosaccharomyces cryophilus OY26]